MLRCNRCPDCAVVSCSNINYSLALEIRDKRRCSRTEIVVITRNMPSFCLLLLFTTNVGGLLLAYRVILLL